MSKQFKPFTSALTKQLLDVDKYIGEIRLLLRGRGPSYTSKDLMNIRKVMLMRLNADDSKSNAQILFIISLTEKLMMSFHINPLDILERVLPIIHGVNDDNVEQLLELWTTNPNEAERILTEAAATPSEMPVLRPITPQHQKWINDCNSMLDHIFFSTKNFPVAPVARSGSAAVMASAPARTTSLVIPTFSDSTSIDDQITDLIRRRDQSKPGPTRHVFQTRINQLLEEKKRQEGNQGGGRKNKKRYTIKKRSSRRHYKKRSKSIKN